MVSYTQIFVRNDFKYYEGDSHSSTNVIVLRIPKNINNFSELALRMLVIYVQLHRASKHNHNVGMYPLRFEDLVDKVNLFRTCMITSNGKTFNHLDNLMVKENQYFHCTLLLTPTRKIGDVEMKNPYYHESFQQMLRCLHLNI